MLFIVNPAMHVYALTAMRDRAFSISEYGYAFARPLWGHCGAVIIFPQEMRKPPLERRGFLPRSILEARRVSAVKLFAQSFFPAFGHSWIVGVRNVAFGEVRFQLCLGFRFGRSDFLS